MNWRQTYETIKQGPPNKSMIQRYQSSFGDRMTLYRVVIHSLEMVNKKSSGKHNFCYALTNRLPYKNQADEEDLFLFEEMKEQKRQEERPGTKAFYKKLLDVQSKEDIEDEKRKEDQFLKNRFESRYLTCPVNVGSFDVFTYIGKSMAQLEREG